MPNKAKLTTRERSSSNVSSDNLNKGSELSFAEVDSNFINLRDQSIAISDGSTTTDIDAGETITFSGASVSGNTVTITGGSSSSGGNLGDLQVNSRTLSPVSTNTDLILSANGSGNVDVLNTEFSVATATIASVGTTMNTIDGGSSTAPSRLLLKATGGTSAVTGRDKNTIHFESHSGNFMFAKTGGSTANITTEVGSSTALKVSALEGNNTNAGGFSIDGSENAAITFSQKIDMNNFAIQNASTMSASEFTVTGDAGVTLNDNVISTSSSNTDLEIDANGTGAVSILTQKVMMANLPTSNPSVAGQLYNDSGTLKISAG